jgi:hypothetical protein
MRRRTAARRGQSDRRTARGATHPPNRVIFAEARPLRARRSPASDDDAPRRHGHDGLKMSTDDVLLGLGLVTVLAVGSQLLAGRVRLPAIVVLLPVGFLAGIATDDVHPDALLLTANNDFNALAAVALRTELGHGRVYRVAPDIEEMDLLAPPDEPGIPGAESLTSAELRQRFATGARLVEASVDGGSRRAARPCGELALFVVTAAGALHVVTAREDPPTRAGDTVIVLADEE